VDAFDKTPTTWSPDGRFLVYNVDKGPPTGRDIWVLPLTGDRQPFPFAQSNFNEGNAQFSPDGRWVVYTSNESESGQPQVFVAPFPGPGPRSQISAAGGFAPRWRGDGQELFFFWSVPDDRLMAATVDGRRREFDAGPARTLFAMRAFFPANASAYEVTSDGQRFIVSTPADQSLSTGVVRVLVNWTAALKK
jgi:dipeptidyl aminopeptidase/acylaminoacyl peptidase